MRNEAISFIKEENLNEEKAKHYITYSLRRGEVSYNGTDLNAILPEKSSLNPGYLKKKQRALQKIVDFVGKFKNIGKEI